MKKLLALSWLIVLVALFILQLQFKGESTSFFGITDDTGQTISFEYPVDIIDMQVIDGQKVEQGSILLKVRRSSLAAEQAILNEKIKELNLRDSSSVASIKSEIKSLLARKAAEQANLDLQIQKLQAQYQTNKKLLSDITGSAASTGSAGNSFYQQIRVLEKQKIHTGRSLQAQIDHLRAQLNSRDRPIYAQINELKQRRSELDRQATELVVRAKLAGRVGSVLAKPGETIDAFKPIISIHALRPERVKGYINENVYNQVKAGQKVWITSLALNGEAIVQEGRVDNIGNRIVEYPARLKKNILVPAFGREVQITLEDSNTLLLGEKVQIGLQPPRPSLADKTVSYFINFFNSYAKGAYVAKN